MLADLRPGFIRFPGIIRVFVYPNCNACYCRFCGEGWDHRKVNLMLMIKNIKKTKISWAMWLEDLDCTCIKLAGTPSPEIFNHLEVSLCLVESIPAASYYMVTVPLISRYQETNGRNDLHRWFLCRRWMVEKRFSLESECWAMGRETWAF